MTSSQYVALIYCMVIAALYAISRWRMREQRIDQNDNRERDFLHWRSMMQDCRHYDKLCNVRQVMIEQLPQSYHKFTLAIFYGQYWKIRKDAINN